MDRGRCVVVSQREIFRLDSYAKVSIFLVKGQKYTPKGKRNPAYRFPSSQDREYSRGKLKRRPGYHWQVGRLSRAYVTCPRSHVYVTNVTCDVSRKYAVTHANRR